MATKRAKSKLLTINIGPETFNSDLPYGVNGDVSLIKNMTVDNVLDVTVDNTGVYDGNIDGEWSVMFHNGDEIRFDGYYGDHELLCYNSLKEKAKTKALKWFKELLDETVESMKD